MTVYFDKENYINYIKNADKSEVGADTLRMIKRQLNIHLNFQRGTLDDDEVILLEEFEDGVSKDFKISYGQKVTRPLKKDSFPSACGVYLLTDDKVDNIKLLKTHLVGKKGEEIETLSALIINADYSFHKLKEIGVDITPANQLDIFDLPFSTIAIVDRYMFKGPEIGGNLGLFEYNLQAILSKMYAKKSGISNIIFIYQVTPTPRRAEDKDTGPDLEKMAKKVKDLVAKLCPKPDVFFIGVPKGLIDDEHDRYILSNYLIVKSGGSFIFFKSTGVIATDSILVDFYSLGYKEYRAKSAKVTLKLNNIINEALTKSPSYSKVPAGTITSSVINFS